MKTRAGVSSLWLSERAAPHKANAALPFHAMLCLVLPCIAMLWLAFSCHAVPCCALTSCVTVSGSVYQREKESQHRHRRPWYCQVFPWSPECLAALSCPSCSQLSLCEPFCLYLSTAPAEPALHPGAVQPAPLPAGCPWHFERSLGVAALSCWHQALASTACCRSSTLGWSMPPGSLHSTALWPLWVWQA